MTVPIRVLREFLLFKYSKIERMALFEREALALFFEFREWYKNVHYQRSANGVTLKIFTKWLKKCDVIIVPASNRRKR